MKPVILDIAKVLAKPGMPLPPGSSNHGMARNAWLREMENAQINAWLTHSTPVDGSKANVPPAGNSALLPRDSQPLSLALTPETQSIAKASVPATPKVVIDHTAPPQDELASGRSTRTSIQWMNTNINPPMRSLYAGNSAGEGDALPLSKALDSAVAEFRARNPIRVHAQETPDGLSVWIGLDAHEQEDSPPILADVVARFEAQGIRVASLVCNGRVIYQVSIKPQQKIQPLPAQPPYNQESLWQ